MGEKRMIRNENRPKHHDQQTAFEKQRERERGSFHVWGRAAASGEARAQNTKTHRESNQNKKQ